MNQDVFKVVLNDGERIIWSGKPKLIPFLMRGLPFLLFGLIWVAIELFIFKTIFGVFDQVNLGMMLQSLGSFQTLFGGMAILYLMPFWLSLINMLRLMLIYRNVNYAITNRRLMLRSGLWGIDFKSIDYDRVANLEVNVNPIDAMFKVGSLRFFSGEVRRSRNGAYPVYNEFVGITDPYGVYKKCEQVMVDIKTDWNYPNQLRPQDNPGYSTKYNDQNK